MNNKTKIIKYSMLIIVAVLLLGIGIVVGVRIPNDKKDNQNSEKIVSNNEPDNSFIDSIDRLFWRKFSSGYSYLWTDMLDAEKEISSLRTNINCEKDLPLIDKIENAKRQAKVEQEGIRDSLRIFARMETSNLEEHSVSSNSVNLLSHLDKALSHFSDNLDALWCSYYEEKCVISPDCESDLTTKLQSAMDGLVENKTIEDSMDGFFADANNYCQKQKDSQYCNDKIADWKTKYEEIYQRIHDKPK